MKIIFRTISLKLMLFFLAASVLLVLLGFGVYHYFKQKEIKFYTIAVFFDSTSQTPEDLEVIELIIGKKVAEINENGGIAGRNIRIKYLDDKGNPDSTLKVVKESISDKTLIAYLGCWGSSKAIAVAKLIADHKIPFIGGYSVTSLARSYPNMFTYEIGVDQFAFSTYNLLSAKAEKVAFIGNTEDVFSNVLIRKIKALNQESHGFDLVLEKWYPRDHKFSQQELDQIAENLKGNADFLFLSVNAKHSDIILEQIWQHNLKLPLFSGFIDIPIINASIPGFKQAEIYDISVFGIPSALNMRLQVLKDVYKAELKENIKLDFQLGFAALLADVIGLVKASAPPTANEKNIREGITNGLHHYITGDRLYRGKLMDWYFNEDRVLANEAILGWKPANFEKPILAPYQYLRSDSGLIKTQVLYTNVDLVRIDHISDEEGSFNARFYLEISSKNNISIKKLDFANAARNEINQEPLLDIKLMRANSTSGKDRIFNYLYKVSGKFYYSRNLKNYPFDRQQFNITLQTNSAYEPFLIQPPIQFQRDTTFTSPGWEYVSNYVGFDHDIIYNARNFISKPTHIPFYKFNYTYVLKRAQVDFFLKVLTPLLAILIITYFSVFIPFREFEALCGIQVTALLASIALYFSTYKPEMQNATTSDKIFIFTYIMITTLIGTSILIYTLHFKNKEKNVFGRAARFYQWYVFPAIVVSYIIFIRFF
jgi:hypothetical protein